MASATPAIWNGTGVKGSSKWNTRVSVQAAAATPAVATSQGAWRRKMNFQGSLSPMTTPSPQYTSYCLRSASCSSALREGCSTLFASCR
jgi:hypothetical protein